ncbi:leucyl aminopeptidase [Candidatus Peregrinibacteria bacterium]|nr:leucyl aminopeptidase [Candidatus Peregrinibacteria bacterium]
MKISFSKSPNSNIDLLLCPGFSNTGFLNEYNSELKKIFSDLKKNKLLSGKKGEYEVMVNSAAKNLPKKVCFIGFGDPSKLKNSEVRELAAGKMKSLLSKTHKKIGVFIPKNLEKFVKEITEGICLINYTPAKYKTGKFNEKATQNLFDEVVLISGKHEKYKKEAEEAFLTAQAVNETRDFVNAPPNIISTAVFAEKAREVAKQNGYSIKILEKKELEKLKMGLILAVNRGSRNRDGAKMIVLDYSPKGLKKEEYKNPVMLVGKGLIFDSGGYNLKPLKAIEDMQQDKAGGSVVLGVFRLLKKLNIKKRVIGIIPLTENLIDAEAMKPSEVLTAYNGKTVEIRNTDAEGRLILADALSYGVEKYTPGYVVDIATLTGACIIALGDRYAAVEGNDKKLIDALIKAGNKTDELLWEMPMHKEFSEIMKGKIADYRNADDGTAYLGGTMKAGAFLQFFVGKSKWAHIDIAGVAYVDRPKAYDLSMATGFGVRMFIEFLKKF